MLHLTASDLQLLTPTAALSLILALAVPAVLMGLLGRRCHGPRLAAGTHVLITGGSKGLGLALGRMCAARGCSVTVVARNQADLEEALRQLQAAAAGAAGAGGAGAAAAKLQALSAYTSDPQQVGPPAAIECCLTGCPVLQCVSMRALLAHQAATKPQAAGKWPGTSDWQGAACAYVSCNSACPWLALLFDTAEAGGYGSGAQCRACWCPCVQCWAVGAR